MSVQGSGAFVFTGWEEVPYGEIEGGSKLTIARVTNDFHGTIEGSGKLTYIMTYLPTGSAVFEGYELITGSVAGKRGTFVLKHTGTVTNAKETDQFVVSANWQVVEGAGSGELGTLTGTGSFVAQHADAETAYQFLFAF